MPEQSIKMVRFSDHGKVVRFAVLNQKGKPDDGALVNSIYINRDFKEINLAKVITVTIKVEAMEAGHASQVKQPAPITSLSEADRALLATLGA